MNTDYKDTVLYWHRDNLASIAEWTARHKPSHIHSIYFWEGVTTIKRKRVVFSTNCVRKTGCPLAKHVDIQFLYFVYDFFLHSSHTISLSYSVEQGVPAGSRHIMALKSQLHKTVVNCLILGIQSRLDMVLFFRLATVKGFSPLISGIHAQMWLLSLWFLHLGLTNESKQSNLMSWALVNPYLKDVSNYRTK